MEALNILPCLLYFSYISLTALNNVQQGSRADFWRLARTFLGIYKFNCSTWYSFLYLLNFYETVVLKAFRPVGNTCTEYYMKDIPRLSVMVLLHVGYCESLLLRGKKKDPSFLLRLLEADQFTICCQNYLSLNCRNNISLLIFVTNLSDRNFTF